MGAQVFTVACGEMVPDPHKSAIAAIVAVGGFLTVTVCEVDGEPQEFVVARVIV